MPHSLTRPGIEAVVPGHYGMGSSINKDTANAEIFYGCFSRTSGFRPISNSFGPLPILPLGCAEIYPTVLHNPGNGKQSAVPKSRCPWFGNNRHPSPGFYTNKNPIKDERETSIAGFRTIST